MLHPSDRYRPDPIRMGPTTRTNTIHRRSVSAQPPRPRLRRALALGTATAFGLGGLFATPAFAETAPDEAPTSGKTFESNSISLLEDDGVSAVGRDADGNVVIVASEVTDAVSSFEESYSNVVVEDLVGGFTALAETDVVGGAGYYSVADPTSEAGALCSIGFSAWSPTGDPAVVSAGHCTADGTLGLSALTLPSGDPAGGGAADNSTVEPVRLLGELAFAQYGGPENSPGEPGSDTSVDISAIDVVNPELTLLPEVTTWATGPQDDLSLDTTTISSVGTVELSQPVSKSGRTTGLSTSTGPLLEGWAEVTDEEGEDPRVVKGFGGDMVVDSGDSGGAVFQGEKAVGVVSGGGMTPEGVSQIWVADLNAGLALTGGYTIMLAVDAPVLASPANGGEVERGARITGTGPANADIVVTPANGEEFTVQSNGEGNWQFNAPTALGAFAFDVQAVIGFNTSAVNSYELEVVAAPLTAPVISTPADGQRIETGLTSVSGTGFPGATITIDGDIEATTTVEGDGTWMVEADLSYGAYTITATQSFEGETSPVATSKFSVIPVAPVISTPEDGASFEAADAPETSSGVGIEGALVTLSVNGELVGSYEIEGELPVEDETPVEGADLMAAAALPGDNWEIALGDALVTGENVISATQAINGVTSAAAAVTIQLEAAAGEAPGNGNDDGDDLAVTGGPDLLPIGLAAWLFIAAGIASVVVVRKRRASIEG